MNRRPIRPQLRHNFDEVFVQLARRLNSRSPQLRTTGGVNFVAEAKTTRDNRRYISLPHGNRIYEDDWGFRTNSMGQDGQRIGQYAVPLDNWA